jgi:hypothetical protein
MISTKAYYDGNVILPKTKLSISSNKFKSILKCIIKEISATKAQILIKICFPV